MRAGESGRPKCRWPSHPLSRTRMTWLTRPLCRCSSLLAASHRIGILDLRTIRPHAPAPSAAHRARSTPRAAVAARRSRRPKYRPDGCYDAHDPSEGVPGGGTMRRRSILIGVMLASVVALAACGGSSTASPDRPHGPPGDLVDPRPPGRDPARRPEPADGHVRVGREGERLRRLPAVHGDVQGRRRLARLRGHRRRRPRRSSAHPPSSRSRTRSSPRSAASPAGTSRRSCRRPASRSSSR